MNSLVEIAFLLGAPYTLALAIETMVKRRRERQIAQNRAVLVAAGKEIAARRAFQNRHIVADDLRQRFEMAVLFGCPGCGAKPREVADVVVRCANASLPLDHPDRFTIGCVRCMPAATVRGRA